MEDTNEVKEVLSIASDITRLLRSYNMRTEAATIENVFSHFASDPPNYAEMLRRGMSRAGEFGDWGFSIPSLNVEYQSCLDRLKKALDALALGESRSRALEDPKVHEAWDLISDTVDLLRRNGFADRVNVLEDVFRDFLDAPRSYSRIALDQSHDSNAFWHWTFQDQSDANSNELGAYHASMKRLEDLLARIYEG